MCYRVLKVHSWKFDNSLMFSVWRSDLSYKFLFWNCFGNGSTRVLFLLWIGQSFKNRSSKIYGRQPLKNLKWHGLPQHFTWSIFEYFVTNLTTFLCFRKLWFSNAFTGVYKWNICFSVSNIDFENICSNLVF